MWILLKIGVVDDVLQKIGCHLIENRITNLIYYSEIEQNLPYDYCNLFVVYLYIRYTRSYMSKSRRIERNHLENVQLRYLIDKWWIITVIRNMLYVGILTMYIIILTHSLSGRLTEKIIKITIRENKIKR